jgi:hypothetical protein
MPSGSEAPVRCVSRSADPGGRLASDGHRTDGRRPRAIGRQRVGPQPRREEPVHRRWQHPCDCGEGEPNADDPGARRFTSPTTSSSGWPPYSNEVNAGCVTMGYLHTSLEHLRDGGRRQLSASLRRLGWARAWKQACPLSAHIAALRSSWNAMASKSSHLE